MKKGFTLAELIGVLVILALIGTIAIPSVTKIIRENKNNICIIQFNNIIEETKNWGSNNIEKLPSNDGEAINVSFDDLVKYGYAEDNLINPITKAKFTNEWYVKIEKFSNKLQYKIYQNNNWVNPEEYCK